MHRVKKESSRGHHRGLYLVYCPHLPFGSQPTGKCPCHGGSEYWGDRGQSDLSISNVRLGGVSILPRYPELHQAVDEFIERFNRCMIAINFRREPIYLSQETIDQPKYNHYRVAVGAMRELQFLREHFIGRVYHRSLEQWKEDLIKMIPQEV